MANLYGYDAGVISTSLPHEPQDGGGEVTMALRKQYEMLCNLRESVFGMLHKLEPVMAQMVKSAAVPAGSDSPPKSLVPMVTLIENANSIVMEITSTMNEIHDRLSI